MPLKEYRAKRNFSVSPEPPGADRPAPTGPTRFFCVQKHLASHLHYDLRLEHDGVLLSWAVPKGPSIDPAVKRLAMHVEDHPVEYGTFEGVIPDGYGMGIVLLWDEGTWEPLVDDVDAALRKGDLKVRLNGVKLKGSWALVRTAGRRRRAQLAADQASRRMGRTARHRGLRAAERQERQRLHRRDRKGRARHLAEQPTGQGRARRSAQDRRARGGPSERAGSQTQR
jgi:DNA ligase D-like protein (predicted 3'-phosphoesterase)